MPITLDTIGNYARRKDNRILCGRPNCGYEFGGIMHAIDRFRPNLDYEPGQKKLSPEEEREIVDELRYDRLYNRLTEQERTEYLAAEVRVKDDYVKYSVDYEWDFAFNQGWIERSDGFWGLSRRAKQRVKAGKTARFRRPVPHHTTGQTEFAWRQPKGLPVAAECPRCDLVQILAADKLDMRLTPKRRMEQSKPRRVPAEQRDVPPELNAILQQMETLSDAMAERAIEITKFDKVLRRHNLSIAKLEKMICEDPETLIALAQRSPDLMELLTDDRPEGPFGTVLIDEMMNTLDELVRVVS